MCHCLRTWAHYKKSQFYCTTELDIFKWLKKFVPILDSPSCWPWEVKHTIVLSKYQYGNDIWLQQRHWIGEIIHLKNTNNELFNSLLFMCNVLTIIVNLSMITDMPALMNAYKWYFIIIIIHLFQ